MTQRLRGTIVGALFATLSITSITGCASQQASPYRVSGYAFPVPPGVTFDLGAGRVLTEAEQAERLRGVRLLFLGEHHTDARSHAYQNQVLKALAAQGREMAVALEMFPPEADAALEDWRMGRLEEVAFLERSEWYTHWGYAWSHYRALFGTLRDLRIPLRGVNAGREVRNAVRSGDLSALSAALQAELGALEEPLFPHRLYVLDQMREAGHVETANPHNPMFERYYRVQRMWDRLMGLRTARLAEELATAQGANGIAVLLVGSGHLAYGLGANLQAARESALPRLTVWDTAWGAEDGATGHSSATSSTDRPHEVPGTYPVPISMADWVRVYAPDPTLVDYPTLGGVKLEAAQGGPGVEVARLHLLGSKHLEALQQGDLIEALNGVPATSPVALRLAWESLPWGSDAVLDVRRGEERLRLRITLPQQER